MDSIENYDDETILKSLVSSTLSCTLHWNTPFNFFFFFLVLFSTENFMKAITMGIVVNDFEWCLCEMSREN